MKQIDTGGLSFRNLREHNKYYVDKSLLIKDILSTNDMGIYLFTRPRRFGKTTNLTMLDAFFNIKYKGNAWFDDLKISKYPEFTKYKNAFPIVYINLKDTKASDLPAFIVRIKAAIRNTYVLHQDLLENEALSGFDKNRIAKVLDDDIEDARVRDCIPDLCRMLNAAYGVKPIILIDEYDRAVSDAFGEESHRPMMDFLGEFMGSALKNNDSLQMAYVTGIMQIAKESIFSGLNNLRVNNIFSKMSDERFGFTEKEVKDILTYYGHPEKFPEAKEWYDGYRFGDCEVYNPYSIMEYASTEFIPGPYWVNSGGDWIIRYLFERIDSDNIDTITKLVSGEGFDYELTSTLTFSKIDNSEVALYSLMVMAGYLKAVPDGNGGY